MNKVAEMSGKCAKEVKVVISPYGICPLGAHIDHQVGVVEMKVAVGRTGGLVVLAESFGHSVFKDSFGRFFKDGEHSLGLSFNRPLPWSSSSSLVVLFPGPRVSSLFISLVVLHLPGHRPVHRPRPASRLLPVHLANSLVVIGRWSLVVIGPWSLVTSSPWSLVGASAPWSAKKRSLPLFLPTTEQRRRPVIREQRREGEVGEMQRREGEASVRCKTTREEAQGCRPGKRMMTREEDDDQGRGRRSRGRRSARTTTKKWRRDDEDDDDGGSEA
ncbi:hypothetical protein Syun_019198 [Stephania yunnanensis]|uniref:Protein transport protein SEC23 n=1 Tax=Stephania yunnanensis TaxID=152371 RepID=A0AAP0ITP2_9MAGN